MTASILNVNPPTGLITSTSDIAELKIRANGVDALGIKARGINISGLGARTPIFESKSDMVTLAFSRGWIKSAAQINEEVQLQTQK